MKVSSRALQGVPVVVVMMVATPTMLGVLAGCKEEAKPTAEVKNEPTAKATETTKATEPAKPEPTAAASAKAPAATAGAPAATAQAPAAGTLPADGIPEVSTGTSAPPTVAEWNSAPKVNTVGPNSAPRDCEMKVVREWLKINCSGDIKEVTNMEGFGKKDVDYYELVTPGKVADFVVRMKQGQFIKARIIRADQSASLFVNWPQQKAKPSIIALQIYNP